MLTASTSPRALADRTRHAVFVVVLGVLVALGSFTIDLYLPAFPQLKDDFDVAEATIQFTLTATTVGFGVGQLIVGPLSDRIGRRLPMLGATLLHIAASIGVGLATSIDTLLAFRFLQGFGAAAGSVVAMAILRDLYGGKSLVRTLSHMALITGLAPIIAPIVGAQLLLVMPWRGLFFLLAVYGAVAVLAVALLIPETLPPERRRSRQRAATLRAYRVLLRDRVFVGALLVGALIVSGAFAYVASASFLLQSTYGMSPQAFSGVFAVNACAMFVGVQLGGKLAWTIGPQWTLSWAAGALVVTSAAVVVLPVLIDSPVAVIAPLALFLAAFGMGSPCVSVLALDPHPNEAGTAASLLGATNYFAVGVISPLPSLMPVDATLSLGIVILVTSLLAVAAVIVVLRPGAIAPLEN